MGNVDIKAIAKEVRDEYSANHDEKVALEDVVTLVECKVSVLEAYCDPENDYEQVQSLWEPVYETRLYKEQGVAFCLALQYLEWNENVHCIESEAGKRRHEAVYEMEMRAA